MQTAEDIVKLLSRPASPIILVLTPSADRLTLQRGAKYTGVGICDFRLKSRFISETVRQTVWGPWLLWNVGKKSEAADRSVPVPMTLSDLESRDARVKFSG